MPENCKQQMLGPAAEYRHDHPPVRNINDEFAEQMTTGQKIADPVGQKAYLRKRTWLLLQSGGHA